MAWALKLPLADEVIESGLVQDFDASLSGIGQELGAGAYSMSDVLALPIFKQEESSLPPENENEILPFQYVLCAATSPAVKLHDETLTYLNQGQSYEIRMLDNRKLGELPEINGKLVKSIFRVVFHDRRLQYTEHQQLEGWRWNRPGDRILDIDIPMSVGVIDPRANPTQLNTVEFLWDPAKRTSVFIQVHCISTEFTMRKHGGEKGVPFRVQIDTFKENENGEYTEHLHSASCQIKVFKPKGADRKQKIDREKMEKRTPHEKEKYQPSYETTILTECSPWPEITYVSNSPSPGFNSSHSSFSLGEGNGSPNHQPEPPPPVTDNLLPTTTPQEAQQWLHRNRFSTFTRLFTNFSGADLLKLTRDDVIQICGPADGIRLFNALKGRMVRPRLTIYVCQESLQLREQPQQPQPQQKQEDGDSNVYHAIYLEELTAVELTEKIAQEKVKLLFEDLGTGQGLAALSFSISSLTLIGMLAAITYTAYGMSALPLNLIKGTRSTAYERLENTEDIEEVEQHIQTIRSKSKDGRPLSARDRRTLKQCEERLRTLRKRERHLEFIENSWWTKFCGALRPLKIIWGIFFILVALLFVISLFLSNLDKALHSAGIDSGFIVFGTNLSNPLNMLLPLLQTVFPLDYILITIIIMYFIFTSMAGIRNIGIWFFWIRLYKIRRGRTRPQALLFLCMILLLIVLHTSYMIYSLAPQYVMYGSQNYLIESNITSDAHKGNSTLAVPKRCDADAPKDQCTVTRTYVFLHKFWFFSAAYYFGNWAFLVVFLIGLIVSCCKGKKSVIEGVDEDSDLSDDEPSAYSA